MYEIIPGRLAYITLSGTRGGMCINNFHMADIALYRTHIDMVVGSSAAAFPEHLQIIAGDFNFVMKGELQRHVEQLHVRRCTDIRILVGEG